METKTIPSEYEITCEFDHAQYWQGAGTAFTDWDEVFTGAGCTPRDAYQDALNHAAEDDYDVQAIEWEFASDETTGDCECGPDYDECEHSYFVSIFVK